MNLHHQPAWVRWGLVFFCFMWLGGLTLAAVSTVGSDGLIVFPASMLGAPAWLVLARLLYGRVPVIED